MKNDAPTMSAVLRAFAGVLIGAGIHKWGNGLDLLYAQLLKDATELDAAQPESEPNPDKPHDYKPTGKGYCFWCAQDGEAEIHKSPAPAVDGRAGDGQRADAAHGNTAGRTASASPTKSSAGCNPSPAAFIPVSRELLEFVRADLEESEAYCRELRRLLDQSPGYRLVKIEQEEEALSNQWRKRRKAGWGSVVQWYLYNIEQLGDEMADLLDARAGEIEKAYGYLSRLWKIIAPPGTEVGSTLLTLCTQFDNYIAGQRGQIAQLTRDLDQARRERDEKQHTLDATLVAVQEIASARAASEAREAALREALERLVANVLDYEQVNKLSPGPGRKYCWDSTEHAVKTLSQSSPVPEAIQKVLEAGDGLKTSYVMYGVGSEAFESAMENFVMQYEALSRARGGKK